MPLATFLNKVHGGTGNQTKRFLATAAWLRSRGTTNLATGEVTKALRLNHQGKLTNPSQCLAENVSKGYAEKDGKGFYITPEGLKSLGLSE